MEGLLAPGTGRVSGMLVEFRKQLQEAAAGELEGIAAKVEEVVSQLRSANGQLDELLQHSEEARTLAANEVSNAEDRMMDTLRLFDLLTRQELLQLAQQQQQCAQKEIESFQVKLDGMHLHEHVLETLVDKFASDLEDYRERRRVSRLLTFMDLSAAFAGPRPQSVCSVLMHLVRQKPAARDVAVVFVYGVDPPKASGLDMNAPLAVPSPQVLRAAAASWKARTEVYGHRATSYAVVRVEGLLLEVFTVPFLEGERIGFAADDELRAAEPAEFAAKLAEAVNEANLTSGSEAPFSLVVYLGQLKEDRVRPPPTRDLSHNRTLYVRHMVQHLKPATRSLAAVWERLRAQLQFIDAAAAALKEGSSNGEAVQLSVRRLDVEIICFSAPVPPPPCRRDPHLREALHYLQIRLLPISGGFVVPDEAVLTAALTSLVRMVHGGGPSCPLVVTTTQKKKKHFWQRPTYSASIDLRTTDLSKRSGSEKGGGGGAAGGGDTEDEAPVAASKGAAAAAGAPPSLAPSPSALGGTAAVSLGPLEGAPGGTPSLTKGAEEGRHEEGAHPELYDLRSSRAESYRDSLHAAEKGGLWDRRGEGPRTAREVKGITLRDAVAGLAKAAESVVLLSEPWTRGYTLYIHTRTRRHSPPSPSVCSFWLMLRRPADCLCLWSHAAAEASMHVHACGGSPIRHGVPLILYSGVTALTFECLLAAAAVAAAAAAARSSSKEQQRQRRLRVIEAFWVTKE
ncbi:hypothetical protein Efla_006153 [Eimeria flavescens]